MRSPRRAAPAAGRRLTARRLGAAVLLGLALALAPRLGDGQRHPLRGQRLYVNPASPAQRQAEAWRRSRPADAAHLRRIAEQPQAIWLGEWARDSRAEVDRLVTQIERAGAVPVLVIYAIPHRDCGQYSAGGARGGDAYRRWIRGFAQGLRNRAAVVILEPDGLASIDCLPLRLRDERMVLMREAVQLLSASGAAVYVDAGNGNWRSADDMARMLRNVGIERAQGFALNVSNFHGLQPNLAYGERLSRLVGGKHFVIDTSRNGRGAAVEREWCNARGQALGRAPTTSTGHPLADAYLWIKTPGESDGTCNGGPRAGTFWPEYALELSRNAEAIGSLRAR
ncbi:MAG TPA: glycoside hydrolase family 6 protein [Longimicrobium sp.]|nr:glycoside hydrolase family 6 protein [Longimicrobium sp.]